MSIVKMIYFLIPVLSFMLLLMIIMEIILLASLKKKGSHLYKKKKRENKKKQKELKKLILYLLAILLFLSASFIGINYVRNNQLAKVDKQVILESQNIILDLEKEVQLMENAEVEQIDFEKTMIDIGSIMATKGSHQASEFYPEENQKLLNRYYGSIKELGILISNDVKSLYNNKSRINELKQDIKKVNQYEKKVNKKYKLNKKVVTKGVGI